MPINSTLGFSLTPVRRAIIKETKQQQMLAKMGGGKSTRSLMLEMQIKAAATEVSVENLYNTTNTVTT